MTDSVLEYGRMTPDELVDHLIDENGLVLFLETQQHGKPYESWDWNAITTHLQGFSRGYLTMSPGYLQDLYEMQAGRLQQQSEEAVA